MTQTTREKQDTAAGPGMREWRILAVVLLGPFMAVLDTTIVNVVLPSIAQGINASPDALEWVVSGYALAFVQAAWLCTFGLPRTLSADAPRRTSS